MKKLVIKVLKFFGLDLRVYNVKNSEICQLIALLNSYKVNLILDIGANVGQFAEEIRSAGYKGRILSFEPSLDAYNQLIKRSKSDPLWEVAPRCAIGAENGEVEINISKNSVSSSILDMLDEHKNSAPESIYVSREKVPIFTIDKLLPNFVTSDSIVFMKVDTQGYEEKVLEGAKNSLSRISGFELELSLVPLYAGGILFDEMIKIVNINNFKLCSVWSTFVDEQVGKTLQVNGVFFKD